MTCEHCEWYQRENAELRAALQRAVENLTVCIDALEMVTHDRDTLIASIVNPSMN